MTPRPRILVSNDDGVHSEGLLALAEALLPLGEVVVCAPDRERSATSRSISLGRPLRLEELPAWGGGKVRRLATDGTPTDAVYLGINHVLRDRKPDLVVSGINRGVNLASDIHYSGTVAAAMEGAVHGVAAIAFSLAGRSRKEFTIEAFGAAAQFARTLSQQVLQHGLPLGTLLNVNIPAGQPSGVEITRVGRRAYAATVVEKTDPRGRSYYWIGGDEQAHEPIEGSDCDALLVARRISVTPLHLDLTQVPLLDALRHWELPLRVAPAPPGA